MNKMIAAFSAVVIAFASVAQAEVATVEISGNDQMQFDKKSFETQTSALKGSHQDRFVLRGIGAESRPHTIVATRRFHHLNVIYGWVGHHLPLDSTFLQAASPVQIILHRQHDHSL